MKNRKLKILFVLLSIIFFPVTLLVLIFKSSTESPKKKEITMDDVVDIEELFED